MSQFRYSDVIIHSLDYNEKYEPKNSISSSMLLLSLTTIVTFGVTPSFTQVVDNDGVEEEEDTINGDSVIVMGRIL